MNTKELHKSLDHLSEDKINELISRYYNNENVNSLLTEFDIDVGPSNLCKLFPPISHPDFPCPNCGNSLSSQPQSKSKRRSVDINYLFCTNCGHTNNSIKNCQCNYCSNIRKRAEARREEVRRLKECERKSIQEIIKRTYDINNNTPYHFDDLNFRHKVYLSTICKALLIENYSPVAQLYPIEIFDQAKPISPTDEYTKKIFVELCRLNILIPSPISDILAFVQEDECGNFDYPNNFPNIISISKVWFVINVTSNEGFDALIQKLLIGDYYNSEVDEEEALKIWQSIAKQECINYFEYQLNSVQFSTNFGKKTNFIVEKLLENFSVSQIYALIWKEVASASKAFLEHQYSRTFAKNIAISGVERYGERALENGWDIIKYSRNKNVPQSILSEVFFNNVLFIKDDGFNKAPNIDLL